MTNQPTNTFLRSARSGTRLKSFIVVREISKCCTECMLEMFTQTLKRWDHIPGVTDVAAVGIDPIQSGMATFPNGKQVRVFYAANNRAVLFEHEGVMYLSSTGRAATRNTDFEGHSDAFVALLCDANETYRQVHLNSYTGSRLWDVVAMMAAMERYWIAQRLLAGLNGHGFFLRSSRQWEWDL